MSRTAVPRKALRHQHHEQGRGTGGSAADSGDDLRAPSAAVRQLPEDVHGPTAASGPRRQVPSERGRHPFGDALCARYAPSPPREVAGVGGRPAFGLYAVRAGGDDGRLCVPGFPPHGNDSRQPAYSGDCSKATTPEPGSSRFLRRTRPGRRTSVPASSRQVSWPADSMGPFLPSCCTRVGGGMRARTSTSS